MVEDDIDQMIGGSGTPVCHVRPEILDFLQYSGQTMYDFEAARNHVTQAHRTRLCIQAIRRAHEEQFKLSDEAFEERRKAAEDLGVSTDVFNSDYLKTTHSVRFSYEYRSAKST